MKKLIAIFFVCVLTIAFIHICVKTPILYNVMSKVVRETEASQQDFTDRIYYSQLTSTEKQIYSKIDTVIQKLEKEVIVLGRDDLFKESIINAYEAYMLDSPEIFYLKNDYNISEMELFNNKKMSIQLAYIEDNRVVLQQKIEKLNAQVENISKKIIHDDMTEYEKELALHDYLVKNTVYYEYTNVEDIPEIKHTAYGALVDGEAVCDGISKAFSILLKKADVSSIVVTGATEDAPHAWNKVKIDGEWYNADVTSDSCGVEKALIHVYFNLTDSDISKTHKLDNRFKTPNCISTKYEYYSYNRLLVDNYGNINSNLKRIMQSSNGESLEFKVTRTDAEIEDIANVLYSLDFNGYKTRNERKLEYYNINDVYVFIQNKR